MKKRLFIFAISAPLLWAACAPSTNRQLTEFDEIGCWSAVGSAGTIDDAQSTYALGTPLRTFITPDQQAPLPSRFLNLSLDGVASIRPTIESTNASIRYNIGVLLENKSETKEMSVRYLITDKSKQRLLVILKKYARQPSASVTEEQSEVVRIFDSNQFPSAATFQTQSVVLPRNDVTGTFDFSNFAYYVEAVLIRNGLEQNAPNPTPDFNRHAAPALGIVSICKQEVVTKPGGQ